jgi:hypothetical protein
MRFSFVAVLLSAALSSAAYAQPDLGFASSYAVLGRSVSNSGATTVLAGNAGGNTITGLSRSNFVLGDPRLNDSAAQRDAAAAYAALAAAPCSPLPDGPVSPGVYCVQDVRDSLTLDAGGNPNAIWIFRVPGSLTTKPGSTVQTSNEGRDNNVYWRVEGSATFGTNSVFAGNVLAAGDIRVERNATISGRLLTPGAISLIDAGVTICCALLDIAPHVLPSGTTGRDYSLTLTPKGGSGSYRFALAASDPPLSATVTEQGSLTIRQPPAGVYKLAIAISDSTGISCIRVYRLVICGPVTLSPLPSPTACVFYDKTITAEGGTPPYTYKITSGSRPMGLDFLESGRLFGTPIVQDYDFTVTATDVFGCSGSRSYTGHISGDLRLLPETDTLPEGMDGADYGVIFRVIDGTGPYTFTFSGGVPPGLLPEPGPLSPSPSPEQALTGRPKPGCYRFTVTVTTAACSVSREYKLVVRPVSVVFSPDPLPSGTACTLYCQTISTGACDGAYSFDDLPAGTLPPDVKFDPKTGKLCGTPRNKSKTDFTITARDTLGNTVKHPYTLDIFCPVISMDPELTPATACVIYQHQLDRGCDGSDKFKLSANSSLPADLTLSEEGLISGIPATPGDYTFNVDVTAKECPPVTIPLHLKVRCAITISPPALPYGRVGIPYSAKLSACGGPGPYIFSLGPGAPPGLSLMPNDTLSGIPTSAGCFTFTITATGGCDKPGTREYVVCILPPAAPASAPVLSGWGMGVMAALLALTAFIVLRRSCV